MRADRSLGIERVERTHACRCAHTHTHVMLYCGHWQTPLLPEGCVWAQSTIGPMSEPQVAQSTLYTVINTAALVTAS